MTFAGRTADGGTYFLRLQMIPDIPGNGVAFSGQELTGGLTMRMAMIPPHPPQGKKETIDYLVGKYIKPHASDEKQTAKVRKIVRMYAGLEPDTIFALSYALQGGRFEETALRFESHDRDFLSKADIPETFRCMSDRNFKFFDETYKFVEAKKYQ